MTTKTAGTTTTASRPPGDRQEASSRPQGGRVRETLGDDQDRASWFFSYDVRKIHRSTARAVVRESVVFFAAEAVLCTPSIRFPIVCSILLGGKLLHG